MSMSAEAGTSVKNQYFERFQGLVPIALAVGALSIVSHLVTGLGAHPTLLSMEGLDKFLHDHGLRIDENGHLVPDRTNELTQEKLDKGDILEPTPLPSTEGTIDFIVNIESGSVTIHDFDDMLTLLQKQHEYAERLLSQFLLFNPPSDPDLVRLKGLVEYYASMHDGLGRLKPDFIALDNARSGSGDFATARDTLKAHITALKVPNNLNIPGLRELTGRNTIGLESIYIADKVYSYERAFLLQGQPGEVIYTDPKTNISRWVPLRDLIPFKDGTLDNLPITTSGKFYWYYRLLAMHGILDPATGRVMPGITVTEGFGLTSQHVSYAHKTGLAIDFVLNDRAYTAQNIAHYIGMAQNMPNVSVVYEATSLSPEALRDLREEVIRALKAEYGRSDAYWRAFVYGDGRPGTAHVVMNADASGNHFHFENTGATRVSDTIIPLRR